MTQSPPQPFNLTNDYAFLEDGGAAPVLPGGAAFWTPLMSGPPFSPAIRRVAEGSGWLTAQYAITSDSTNWERHPNGSELLIMAAGAMAIMFEMGSERFTVELLPGNALVVPAGVWHRQIVRVPGTYIGVTYGKGTEHRPL
jgi:Mannose-6-phosphate isomerase